MKKKLLITLMAVVMAAGAMFALTGCTPKERTATVAQVGLDAHMYIAYSTVKVDKDKVAKEVKIDETYSPSGKLNYAPDRTDPTKMILNYRNPWSPKMAQNASMFQNTTATLLTKAELQAIIDIEDNKDYISIDGEIFELKVIEGEKIDYYDAASKTVKELTADTVRFVSKTTATKILTDKYIAENIVWYLDAIKNDKMFECDAAGTKVTGFAPDQGAFVKADANSKYNKSRGLDGPNYVSTMNRFAAFAIEKNCAFEYVDVTSAGNYEGKRVKDFTITVEFESDVAAGATATQSDKYLQYQASYAKVIKAAYDAACAKKK